RAFTANLFDCPGDQSTPETGLLRRLHKMASVNLTDAVVAAAANGHGKFEGLFLDLPDVNPRLHSQHIVERRQLETSARQKKDTEILGMPIRCTNEPEQDLTLEECDLILAGRVAPS